MADTQKLTRMINDLIAEINPADRSYYKKWIRDTTDNAIRHAAEIDCRKNDKLFVDNGFSMTRDSSGRICWIKNSDKRFVIFTKNEKDSHVQYLTSIRENIDLNIFMNIALVNDPKRAISAISDYILAFEKIKKDAKTIGATITESKYHSEDLTVIKMSYLNYTITVQRYYNSWRTMYKSNTAELEMSSRSISAPVIIPRLRRSDYNHVKYGSINLQYPGKNEYLHYADVVNGETVLVGLCDTGVRLNVAAVYIKDGQPTQFRILTNGYRPSLESEYVHWKPTPQVIWAVTDFINRA